MNTIELHRILSKAMKKCNFIGVFACDQLPLNATLSRPLALVVNTDPSHQSGTHWLAVYIDTHNQASFFDSFGNPPDRFAKSIGKFLEANCNDVQYITRQVQSSCSAVCGQHCVFFLLHMDKSEDYDALSTKYKVNTHTNDRMVCRFVKKLHPSVTCKSIDNTNCIQCAVSFYNH